VFLLCCGLVWFGSVGKMKTTNQTMRLSKKVIQMQFFAVSVWVDSVCGFSIGLVRF